MIAQAFSKLIISTVTLSPVTLTANATLQHSLKRSRPNPTTVDVDTQRQRNSKRTEARHLRLLLLRALLLLLLRRLLLLRQLCSGVAPARALLGLDSPARRGHGCARAWVAALEQLLLLLEVHCCGSDLQPIAHHQGTAEEHPACLSRTAVRLGNMARGWHLSIKS